MAQSIAGAHPWHGRRGPVLLGPTEHRVALFLADLTRRGLVTIRMAELVDRLHIGRREAYRITSQLRVLGLFGIEDDKSGARGGRRIWRLSGTEVPTFDPDRQRRARYRIIRRAQVMRQRAMDTLHGIRRPTLWAAGEAPHGSGRVSDGAPDPSPHDPVVSPRRATPPGTGGPPALRPGRTFRELTWDGLSDELKGLFRDPIRKP